MRRGPAASLLALAFLASDSNAPDGAISKGNKNIRAAWLTDPTRRYRHGVIGDAIEAGGLAVETRTCANQSLALEKISVFEDRVARLVDMDGDGKMEIAAVVTPHIGGTLTLYEFHNGRLTKDGDAFGYSNHTIGSRQLGWSAILDVNGDGVPDMAVPSANRRTLRAVSFAGGFSELTSVPVGGKLATAIITADLDGDGKNEILYGLENDRLKMIRFVR